MTKVTIDRELLERIDESAICDGTDATIRDDLFTQLVAALATPRQPAEVGELGVVASQFPEINFANYGQDEVEALQAWGFTALDAMADAQRAITELREECERLRMQLAERDARIASMRAEVTQFIETHWVPVAHQRDRLADLLDGLKSDLSAAMNWGDLDRIAVRIDATLAKLEGKA